jgi:hypothetical protein
MILSTEQNPKVTGSTNDFLLMAVDRGNSATKFAISINGKPLMPFKVASVIRRVFCDEVIKIGDDGYVCGDKAISMSTGILSTPLQEGDKIKNLKVVIAQAIEKVSKGRALTSVIDVSLVVSSPFASEALKTEIINEVKALSTGFSVEGSTFKANVIDVDVFFEGACFLETATEFNGAIDLGYGTILGGYRSDQGVFIVPLMSGDSGGVNLVLHGILNDEKFLKAVKKSGASAPPSAEKLAVRLAEGNTTLRNIDLKPFIKSHLSTIKHRIENAAGEIKTRLRLSDENPPTPKLALLGGGCSLIRLVLDGKSLETWTEKHSIELIESPDYQTVSSMHQLKKTQVNR